MKKFYLVFIGLLIGVSAFAQKDITLQLNHKLGSEEFELEKTATNNVFNEFRMTRVQYYLSNITIIHDAGIETLVPDLWVLVDATEQTNINLGSHDVDNIEGFSFSIGINPEVNHDDPAAWPEDHPLAPKNPNMHWGWTSGYKFVALEGNAGLGFAEIFQMHGLGDENYFEVTFAQVPELVNDVYRFAINADYNKSLENIVVKNGVISHGFTNEALTALENFRDLVFSVGSFSSSLDDEKYSNFKIFPNPSLTGTFHLEFSDHDLVTEYIISNAMGQVVRQFEVRGAHDSFQIEEAGIYVLSLYKNGMLLSSERLVVNP